MLYQQVLQRMSDCTAQKDTSISHFLENKKMKTVLYLFYFQCLVPADIFHFLLFKIDSKDTYEDVALSSTNLRQL